MAILWVIKLLVQEVVYKCLFNTSLFGFTYYSNIQEYVSCMSAYYDKSKCKILHKKYHHDQYICFKCFELSGLIFFSAEVDHNNCTTSSLISIN